MIPLSPKYNCQIRELGKNSESKVALKEAYIIHYSSSYKPWSYKCSPKWIKHYMCYGSPEYLNKLRRELIFSILLNEVLSILKLLLRDK